MESKTILMLTIIFALVFSTAYIADIGSGEGDVHIQKLYGVVYEKSGTRAAGEPVPGAEVYIEQEPVTDPRSQKNSTVTGDDGSYEIYLPNGTYKVTVKKAGYETFTTEIVIKAGEDLNKDLVLVKKGESLGVEMSCEGTTKELKPGETCTFRVRIRNTGIKTDSYKVDISGENREWASLGAPMLTRSSGGPYSQSTSNMEDDGIADMDVNITVPEDAEPGDYEFTLKVTSTSDATVEDEINITVKVVPDAAADDDESTPGPGILMVSISVVLVSLIALVRRSKRDH
ncbi:MAG: carboxypeptidase regulatory-like domain-containing protein [Thermoplasmatota archaeon]